MIGPIRLVVVAEAVRRAATAGPDQLVYGTIRPNEHLVQVLSAVPEGAGALYPVGLVNPTTVDPGFQLTIDLPEHPLTFEFLGHEPLAEEVETVEMMEVAAGLDSRRIGLVPEQGLRKEAVLLVGAGSVGSVIGLLLAEAGVGRIVVVDPDHLHATNLSRHACDLADLGRAKAAAVAELLGRRYCEATAVERDILTMSEDELDDLVHAADLVVASTDSAAAQFIVNEACVRMGRASLFIGAYERACGGEVIVVRPGRGPCLFCAVGFRADLPEGVALQERRQAYQAANADRLDAEPGLGVDIAYLSSVAAAHAIAILDPSGSRANLVTAGRSFILLHGGSEPHDAFADLFHGPFDFVHARVRRPDPCPICGWRSNPDVEQG